MKKIFLCALALNASLVLRAQDVTSGSFSTSRRETRENNRSKIKNANEVLPKFCIDANFRYGSLYEQQISNMDYKRGYDNPAMPAQGKITGLSFSKGRSMGADLQAGYFFGKEHIFGIGTGAIMTMQQYDLSVKNFDLQYLSIDTLHQQFTQQVRMGGNDSLLEHVKMTNICIPLMAKFKYQFNHSRWGIMAEAGPMLNLNIANSYVGSAMFNYEAIYNVIKNGETNIQNGPGPTAFTEDNANRNRPAGFPTAADYLNDLHNRGYNVKLHEAINSSGHTQYASLGYGALVQAGISYQLDYRVTLNISAYDMYQVNNNNPNNFRITDKVGEYRSVTNGLKSLATNSIGGCIGLRFYLGKDKDVDGDGIADKRDECPTQEGPKIYNGCPDSDGDGISDREDGCPTDPGPFCTNGCADRDDDCVADNEDQCPDEPGLPQFAGCNSRASYDKSFAENRVYIHDTVFVEGEGGIPHHIMLSKSTINFATGSAEIPSSANAALDAAADTLARNEKLIIFISGHTDDIGNSISNIELSLNRAKGVRKYLLSKGVSKFKIIVSGMGQEDPIIDNDTPENRAKNRRIEMKLLMPI